MNLDECIWLSQLQHSGPGPVRDTKLNQSVDSNEKWKLNVFLGTSQLSAGCMMSAVEQGGSGVQLSPGCKKPSVGQGGEYRPDVCKMYVINCRTEKGVLASCLQDAWNHEIRCETERGVLGSCLQDAWNQLWEVASCLENQGIICGIRRRVLASCLEDTWNQLWDRCMVLNNCLEDEIDGMTGKTKFIYIVFFLLKSLQLVLTGISGSDLFETFQRNHYLYDTFNCIGHVQSIDTVHHVFVNRETLGHIGVFSNLGTWAECFWGLSTR